MKKNEQCWSSVNLWPNIMRHHRVGSFLSVWCLAPACSIKLRWSTRLFYFTSLRKLPEMSDQGCDHNKTTLMSFPLLNLICCLGILLQINRITPYTQLQVQYFVQFIFKYIVFIGLFTKHVLFMYTFSCQCNVTFFQRTPYKKVY